MSHRTPPLVPRVPARSRSPRPPAAAAALLALAALSPVAADDHRTPRAGEAVTATVLGQTVATAARERTDITYLSAGLAPSLDGPEGTTLGPMGGLYLWRAKDGRLRAILAGIANELRWDSRLGGDGHLFSAVTLDTVTLPWARSEYVDGVRLADGEMKWHQARFGFGLAWRTHLPPGQCDNALDVALTFEAGDLWFQRGPDTAPDYVLPSNAFEARGHLRGRVDTLERNLLELPHAGWAAGLDAVFGRRSRWEPWGLPADGLEAGALSWIAVNGFAVSAFRPFPGLSERHRAIASVHAGVGSDLDRFSAFRLGGGSTWGDFETLSRIVLPGAGVDELYAPRYVIADLELRYELLFFLYLQLRGTLAWADLPGATPAEGTHAQSFTALTAGLTSGLPWDFALELAVARNFDLVTVKDGTAEKGRTSLLVSLTREF